MTGNVPASLFLALFLALPISRPDVFGRGLAFGGQPDEFIH
jgi:hypothetical protein